MDTTTAETEAHNRSEGRITLGVPAIVLAPMDGLTDAPMRAIQGDIGAYTFAVSEFVRISASVPSVGVYHRHIPELLDGARTPGGRLPVQVQLLGGDPGRMAESAVVACAAGARAIDINFGCPAPTVNNHDGGATLLKHPARLRAIVAAVRAAVPPEIPVSAKMRLGWNTMDAVDENAAMAAEGGAAWITIHGRTREQGYQPPAYWGPIGRVRESLGIPVVANGDLWSLAAFRRCREETGCEHFMLGRGGIANPFLSHQIAAELGMAPSPTAPVLPLPSCNLRTCLDWRPYLERLIAATAPFPGRQSGAYLVRRMKQWLKIATMGDTFSAFDAIKRAESVEELFALLAAEYDRNGTGH